MKAEGIFSEVNDEIGEIIVADINRARIEELTATDGAPAKANPQSASHGYLPLLFSAALRALSTIFAALTKKSMLTAEKP